ncbi:MAG: hypothetical protein ABJ242_05380 [Marinomonas sp.]
MTWDLDRLKEMSSEKIRNLYRNAITRKDSESLLVARLIVENGLLVDEKGGLPFDHPIMLEIEEICAMPEAVAEALEAAQRELPPLAGMEHRLVAALGSQYGGQYTTHHAGRCIGSAMLDRGWKQDGMKPMPKGSIAKTATIYTKKETV